MMVAGLGTFLLVLAQVSNESTAMKTLDSPSANPECLRIPVSTAGQIETFAEAREFGIDTGGRFEVEPRGVLNPRLDGKECLRFHLQRVRYTPGETEFALTFIDLVPGDPDPDCVVGAGQSLIGIKGQESTLEIAGLRSTSLFRKNDLIFLDVNWTLSSALSGTSRVFLLCLPEENSPRIVAVIDLYAFDQTFRYPNWIINENVSIEDVEGIGVPGLQIDQDTPIRPETLPEGFDPYGRDRLNLTGIFDLSIMAFVNPANGQQWFAPFWK